MASAVLHTLKSLASPYVVRRAAAFIAETPEATSSAIEAAIPALLEALSVAIREPPVLGSVHALATAEANDGALLQNVGSVFSTQHAATPMARLGTAMIDQILGQDVRLVSQAIAERSGIKMPAADAILRSVAPLVLAAAGQHLRAQGEPSQAALLSLLTALPPPLSSHPGSSFPGPSLAVSPVPAAPVAAAPLSQPMSEAVTSAGAAGVREARAARPAGAHKGRIADRIQLIVMPERTPRPVLLPAAPVPRPVVNSAPVPAAAAVAVEPAPVRPRVVEGQAAITPASAPAARAATDERPRGRTWPFYFGGIAGLLLIFGIPAVVSWLSWPVLEVAEPRNPVGAPVTRGEPQRQPPRDIDAAQGARPRLALDVPEGSMERRVIRYIEDSKSLSSLDWFELDRITFQTGTHTLTASSAEQIRNVAEILKAYPTVRLKIGGYTDNVGDPARNLDLSSARANTVLRALVDLGIAPVRLAAEGYGDQHPVADNATAEGRARNRRIAFRVTQR